MKQFPELSGSNLEGKLFNIPSDLEGTLKLLIIPFKRWHQELVDSWVPKLEEISNKFPEFRFYEIPTLNIGYKLMRFMIDGGMKAGIPSKKVRERTITVYLNKIKFKQNLNIPSEDDIYLYLIDIKGEIIWEGKGGFNDITLIELQKNLDFIK